MRQVCQHSSQAGSGCNLEGKTQGMNPTHTHVGHRQSVHIFSNDCGITNGELCGGRAIKDVPKWRGLRPRKRGPMSYGRRERKGGREGGRPSSFSLFSFCEHAQMRMRSHHRIISCDTTSEAGDHFPLSIRRRIGGGGGGTNAAMTDS